MKTKPGILKTVTTIALMMSSVIVGCLLFQYCQKIDTDDNNSLDAPKEYTKVGNMHNEGLDYIFAEIQDKCIEYAIYNEGNPINAKAIDYPAIVREATTDFCRTNPKTKDNSELYEASILHSGFILKSRKATGMKPKQQELLNEIELNLKTEFTNKNLKRLKGELALINKKASMELPENDAAAIYCATSTAYSTFQYWNRNYRAWYFALHYPEILEQYKKEELNKLSLKSAVIAADTISGRVDWFKRSWDNVEGWFFNGVDVVDEWWNMYGEAILISDCVGAAWGAVETLAAVGPEALVFGPEGLVVAGVGGAIIGGVEASVEATIVSGLLEIGNN